jgi:hypothetical protein
MWAKFLIINPFFWNMTKRNEKAFRFNFLHERNWEKEKKFLIMQNFNLIFSYCLMILIFSFFFLIWTNEKGLKLIWFCVFIFLCAFYQIFFYEMLKHFLLIIFFKFNLLKINFLVFCPKNPSLKNHSINLCPITLLIIILLMFIIFFLFFILCFYPHVSCGHHPSLLLFK